MAVEELTSAGRGVAPKRDRLSYYMKIVMILTIVSDSF
jgi:hypothetical protein